MSPRKRVTRTEPTPVETIRHRDERANIPTSELRGMLADDERSPGKMLYPRDPSLDPQLVWKGKDCVSGSWVPSGWTARLPTPVGLTQAKGMSRTRCDLCFR